MNRFTLIILAALLILSSPNALAGELESDLGLALARLENGKGMLEEREDRSGLVLGEAAAMLESVIEEHQIKSAGIYHALGNAHMLRSDIGHAVLAYRKGEQLDPTNHELRESLAYARGQVAITVTPDRSSRLWTLLLGWRGYVPRSTLWIGFVVLSGFGFAGCSARMLGLVSRTIRVGSVWMIIGSSIPLGMLGLEWARNQGSTDVVIIGSDVLARTGPNDEIYSPAFSGGLQPGVEARQLESRDGWLWLEFGDGSRCWVPAESAKPVNKRVGEDEF